MGRMSKTNVHGNVNKGRMYKVCPECGGNMKSLRCTGFGRKGMFWQCECGELMSKAESSRLRNNFVRSK
jgi:predicted RNA-binding Zn-ribbon protein involved in translation (DUF1610 family)